MTPPGTCCASGWTQPAQSPACAALASASSAIPTRGCWTCTPTSPRCSADRRARRGARDRRSRERVESASAGGRAKGGGDPVDLRPCRGGLDPIAAEITPDVFDWSARVAVGLDRLVEDFELDGLTYYYRGVGGNIAERVAAGLIVGNSLLTAPVSLRPVKATSRPTSRCSCSIGSTPAARTRSSTRSTSTRSSCSWGMTAPVTRIAQGRPVRGLKLYHGRRVPVCRSR